LTIDDLVIDDSVGLKGWPKPVLGELGGRRETDHERRFAKDEAMETTARNRSAIVNGHI
jgi:hypothetical protein